MLKNSINQLISSLNRTEKAYVKKFAFPGKKEKKNVEALKVFDLYAQKGDNLKAKKSISKKLKEKDKRDISLIKNLLFDEVLDCLVGYHEKKMPLVRFGKQITEAEILYDKGLTAEATARMQKIVKELKSHEEFELLWYALNKLKSWFIFHDIDPKTISKVALSQKQMRYALKVLEEKQAFLFDMAALDSILRRTGSVLTFTPEDILALKEIVSKKHYAEDKKAMCFESAYMRHRIKTQYYESIGEENRKINSEEEMLILFENKPIMMKKHLESFVLTLNAYLNSCYIHKRWEEFDSKLEKLVVLRSSMPKLVSSRIGVMIYIFKIRKGFLYNLNQENYELLLHIEEEIKEIEKILPTRSLLALWLNFSLVSFIKKDWKRSVTYSLSTMNAVKPGLYTGMFSMAYLLLLMTHYASKDLNSLDYVIRIWSDFDIEMKPNLARRIATRSFQLLARARSKSEEKAIFRDLEAQAYKLKSNPAEFRIFDSCGFIEWIDEMKSLQ